MPLRRKKTGKKKKKAIKITVIDEEALTRSPAAESKPIPESSREKNAVKPDLDSVSSGAGAPAKKEKRPIWKRLVEREIKKETETGAKTEQSQLELPAVDPQIEEQELARAKLELEAGVSPKPAPKKAAKAKSKAKKRTKKSASEEKLAASIVNLTDKLAELEQTSADYETPKPRPRLYKKIAFIFGLLVLLLVGVIAYYSLVRVDIVVIPAQEQVSNNLIIDVYDQQKADNNFSDTAIAGVVTTIPVSETKTYEASGEKMLSENVVGRVTIINNYIKNQPLVATTRLLTPDEKLFRLKKTINVPAGGSIEAEVYADKPGPEMVIGPTRFIIPGLWAGLQDKIYAVSKEKMHYERKVKKYITQVDIDDAVADLKKSLQDKLAQSAKSQYKDYDVVLFAIDDNSIAQEVYGKVDEEKDEFSMSMSAKAVIVAFNKKDALAVVKKKFATKIGGGNKQVAFNEKTLTYSLNDYAVGRDTASVNVTFDARLALRDNTQIIDPNMLVGLSQRQLEEFLRAQENIAGFEIYFHPSFIKRVPSLVDRIHIQIK